VAGLVLGKPLGIGVASALAVRLGVARAPDAVSVRQFLGAACLCGVGDTMALLMADQAFPQASHAAIAKLAVLLGSVVAAAVGSGILAARSPTRTPDGSPAAGSAPTS
jgi:Na+:H+ antiporter, NhaA family